MNLVLSKKIKAELKSYWHIGSGRGAGSLVDSLIERDSAGLPYVPGKTLKGLMRDVIFHAEGLDFFEKFDFTPDATLTDLVFGQRGVAETNDKDLDQFEVQPGMIRVTNLRLDETHLDWLCSDDGKKYRTLLTRNIYSTKIDTETGVASDGSLRGQEVAIPMTLIGEVDFYTNSSDTLFSQAQQDLSIELLEYILQVIQTGLTHVGSQKSRGFGLIDLQMETA